MPSLRTIYTNIRNRIVNRSPSDSGTPSTTIRSPYSSGTNTATSNVGAINSASSDSSVRTNNVSTTNTSTGKTTYGGGGGGSSRSSSSSSSSSTSLSKVSSPAQLEAVSTGSQTQAQAKGLTPVATSTIQKNQLARDYVVSSNNRDNQVYKQPWKESFKQYFSTSFQNVKAIPNIIWGGGSWSDIQNPLKAFSLSTNPEGSRIVTNPTYTGGQDTGTITTTPMFEQRKFVPKQELYERGLISESAVMGRIGDTNIKTAERIAPAVLIGTASIASPPVAFVAGSYYATRYTPEAFNPNLPKSQRITSGITGGLGFIGAGAGAYGSFAQLEAQQVNIAGNYITQQNKNALGYRFTDKNLARDTWNINSKAGTTTLNIQGKDFYRLTGTNTYQGFGKATQTLKVQGLWTGNIYTSQTDTFSYTAGRLLGSNAQGWTSSMGNIRTITTGQTNTISGSKDLFQPDFLKVSYTNPNTISKQIFAGQTNQGIPNYVYSQSGKVNQVKIFQGDASTRIDVNSALDSRAFLKIKNLDKGFTGFNAGGSGTQIFGSKVATIQTNIAKIQATTGLTSSSTTGFGAVSGLASASAGLSSITRTSGALKPTTKTFSTSSLGSLSSVSSLGTIQIPSTSITTIPSLRSSTSVTTIPSTTTTTIPQLTTPPAFTGFGSSTGRFPITTGGFVFPIIDIPKFKPSFDFRMGNTKTGARARRKYTPSFAGLIFGKKGKSKKRATGFEIRGIPKNFKWEFGSMKI